MQRIVVSCDWEGSYWTMKWHDYPIECDMETLHADLGVPRRIDGTFPPMGIVRHVNGDLILQAVWLPDVGGFGNDNDDVVAYAQWMNDDAEFRWDSHDLDPDNVIKMLRKCMEQPFVLDGETESCDSDDDNDDDDDSDDQ